jgi:hypothetical protein
MDVMDRAQDSRKSAPDVRGLKALVIGMGVLIVLGTALVIGVVVKRMVESTASPGTAATQPAAVPGAAPFRTVLPAAAGASITGLAASGGVIAIWVHDDKGGRVDFIDPHTGTVLGSAAAP